jgi:hypothetical protein
LRRRGNVAKIRLECNRRFWMVERAYRNCGYNLNAHRVGTVPLHLRVGCTSEWIRVAVRERAEHRKFEYLSLNRFDDENGPDRH